MYVALQKKRIHVLSTQGHAHESYTQICKHAVILQLCQSRMLVIFISPTSCTAYMYFQEKIHFIQKKGGRCIFIAGLIFGDYNCAALPLYLVSAINTKKTPTLYHHQK